MLDSNSQREFRGKSRRAKLLLAREESFDVEFKRTVDSVEATDIVAFANSEEGGCILIGVDEKHGPRGRQQGEVVGCDVGEKSRVRLATIAGSCTPPVEIQVFAENLSGKPFLRVEIPHSPAKPHCTGAGVYKIRGDGCNLALLPEHLLSMLLERESRAFIEKFRTATRELDAQIRNLVETLYYVSDETESYITQLHDRVENVVSDLGETFGLADQTAGSLMEIERKIENMDFSVFRTEEKVDALLLKFGVEDPSITKSRMIIKAMTRKFYEIGGEKEARELVEKGEDFFPGVPPQQIKQWVGEELEDCMKCETDES